MLKHIGKRSQKEKRKQVEALIDHSENKTESFDISSDKITVHGWPYGKQNRIFAKEDKEPITENIFAVTRTGVSYLGSKQDFSRESLKECKELSQIDDPGVVYVEIMERCILFDHGQEVWKNPKQNASTSREHYMILLPDRSFDGKFCVVLGNLQYSQYEKVRPDQYENVVSIARSYSEEKNTICLVAKRVSIS